jgi:hypothetical protein
MFTMITMTCFEQREKLVKFILVYLVLVLVLVLVLKVSMEGQKLLQFQW